MSTQNLPATDNRSMSTKSSTFRRNLVVAASWVLIAQMLMAFMPSTAGSAPIEVCRGDDPGSCASGVTAPYNTGSCVVTVNNSMLEAPATLAGSPVAGGYTYVPDGVGTYSIDYETLEGTPRALSSTERLIEAGQSSLGGIYFVWRGPGRKKAGWDLDVDMSIVPTSGSAITEQLVVYANIGDLPADTAVDRPDFQSAFGNYTFSWVGGVGNATAFDPYTADLVTFPQGQLVAADGTDISGTGYELLNGGSIVQTAGAAFNEWPNDELEWHVVAPPGACSFSIFAENGVSFEGFRFTKINKHATCVELEKAAVFNDENNDGFAQVGETISYSFAVTNSGSTPLTNVTVSDPLAAMVLSGSPIASLAAGATDSTTYTGTYTLAAADLSVMSVSNQASVSADDPFGNAVSDLSDDPADATDADADADGDPDDVTVVDVEPAPPSTTTTSTTTTSTTTTVPPTTTTTTSTSTTVAPTTTTTTTVAPSTTTTSTTTVPPTTTTTTPTSVAPSTTTTTTSVPPSTSTTTTVPPSTTTTTTTVPPTTTTTTPPSTLTSAAFNDVSLGNSSGSTVSIDVIGNDPSGIDPTTVAIVGGDPGTGDLVVPGEGVWSVDPATGAISFVPESGFTGNPAPIEYTAEDTLGDTTVRATVTLGYLVPTPTGELAFTGAHTRVTALLGFIMVLLGSAMTRSSRKLNGN